MHNGELQGGTRIQQWDCNGNPQQNFWITPASPGIYEILAFSGKTLDVTGYSTANGAPIQQWAYLNTSN